MIIAKAQIMHPTEGTSEDGVSACCGTSDDLVTCSWGLSDDGSKGPGCDVDVLCPPVFDGLASGDGVSGSSVIGKFPLDPLLSGTIPVADDAVDEAFLKEGSNRSPISTFAVLRGSDFDTSGVLLLCLVFSIRLFPAKSSAKEHWTT